MLLTSLATIERKTEAQSPTTRGMVATWTEVARKVPCLINASLGSRVELHMRETGESRGFAVFEGRVDVRTGDVLAVDGVRWTVDGPPSFASIDKQYQQVPIVRREGGGIP